MKKILLICGLIFSFNVFAYDLNNDTASMFNCSKSNRTLFKLIYEANNDKVSQSTFNFLNETWFNPKSDDKYRCFLDEKLRLAIADVLSQLHYRNLYHSGNIDALHASYVQSLSSKKILVKVMAFVGIGRFNRKEDVKRVFEEALSENHLTYRSAVIGLSKFDIKEAEVALIELYKKVKSPENKQFITDRTKKELLN